MSNKTKQNDTTFEEYAATKPHLYGNHIEVVRGMVAANCPRCAELAKAVAFNDETARHYLAGRTEALQKLAALEAKCAELEATNRQLNREILAVGDEAEDYAGKLAALEAENARLNNRRADGYLYEIPITGGTYNTHYSPRKPTDVRCLNVREVFSNDAN